MSKVSKTTHFGIQRKIVANMTTESWHDVPHVTYIYEPDVTRFLEILKEMNSEPGRAKITINTVLLKVITEGVKAAPQVNAHIEFNKRFVSGTIKEMKDINISVPWILPSGEMMTINLRDMGNRSLDDITELMAQTAKKMEKTNLDEAMYSVSIDNTMKALKKGKVIKVLGRLTGASIGKSKVKGLSGSERKKYYSLPEDERLTKEDIEQGTITVSNIGSTYRNQRGAIALLEIIPPQIFAIGIGATQKKPVVVQDDNGVDRIDIRQVLPMCIAFDHRALDFGEIVPFLERLDDIFDNPEQIKNW
ncbi:MAG: 2-oxo acid dehydrogenase subunit E2 [Clostridiaceae bacterium]|nr:2-oxo acid dehydrogenase subunit E2 [Clostridiaceae bacterium]